MLLDNLTLLITLALLALFGAWALTATRRGKFDQGCACRLNTALTPHKVLILDPAVNAYGTFVECGPDLVDRGIFLRYAGIPVRDGVEEDQQKAQAALAKLDAAAAPAA